MREAETFAWAVPPLAIASQLFLLTIALGADTRPCARALAAAVGFVKTDRSLRAVPLPARAAQALDEHPTRLDTHVLFAGARGEPLALPPWRHREWTPALRAAGLEHRSVYALRHTYASLSIAAGVSLFELSRLMGTSPAMLDRTYGHMLPDALDRARSALDCFINSVAQEVEARGRVATLVVLTGIVLALATTAGAARTNSYSPLDSAWRSGRQSQVPSTARESR